jgi:hypothetical protein
MQKVSLVLRHYNKFKPISCEIISGEINKLFTVKFNDNENNGAEIIKGDPVLIGVLKGEDIVVNGGSVIGATPKEDKFIICSDDIVNMTKELDKREYDRYPASLLGDIKLINSGKRDATCIKNISYSGMCIYSDADYEINDEVEITIYLSNNVSKYDGTVIRKTKNFGRNEYGIQIIHRDKNSIESTKNQLFGLVQNEREIMYRYILSSRFKI